VETECHELAEYIIATKRFNLEVNARSKDRVISFGEKLGCLTMATMLQDVVRENIYIMFRRATRVLSSPKLTKLVTGC
jgi:aspartate kinase